MANLRHFRAQRVLGDHRRAQFADQPVDFVADFRVHMVGPPHQHDHRHARRARFAQDFLPALAHARHIGMVFGIGGPAAPRALLGKGNGPEFALQHGVHAAGEMPLVVRGHVIVDQPHVQPRMLFLITSA